MPDQEALRQAYELPSDAAMRKQMTELTEQTRRLIGCSTRPELLSQLNAVGKPPASALVLAAEVTLARLHASVQRLTR